MKLMYCTECADTISLTYEWRMCKCEKSRAKYRAESRQDADERDDYVGLYLGPCVPFAISNTSFRGAVGDWLACGEDMSILCFTIARNDKERIEINPL